MSTRDAYVEKLKARLDEMNAEIDKLQARSRALEADAEIQTRRKIDQLRERREELSDRISRIREAGAESWEALKEGAERALSELVSGVSEAKERLEPATTSSS